MTPNLSHSALVSFQSLATEKGWIMIYEILQFSTKFDLIFWIIEPKDICSIGLIFCSFQSNLTWYFQILHLELFVQLDKWFDAIFCNYQSNLTWNFGILDRELFVQLNQYFSIFNLIWPDILKYWAEWFFIN